MSRSAFGKLHYVYKSTLLYFKRSWKIMFPMIWSLYSGKHDSEIFCTIIWFLIILLTQRGRFIRLNLFPQNWTVSGRTGRPLSSCNFGEFWVSASSVPLSVCIINDSARYSCVYLLALWGTIRPALILNVLMCKKTETFHTKNYRNKSNRAISSDQKQPLATLCFVCFVAVHCWCFSTTR